MSDDPAPLDSAPVDEDAQGELRLLARRMYAHANTGEALELQRRLIGLAPPSVEDMLFLALLLDATGDLAGGLSATRAALTHFPDEPSLYENLGVFLLKSGDAQSAAGACRDALALGSASVNTRDCLCEALIRLGDLPGAVRAGRRALLEKARVSETRAPVVTIPDGTPPAFDPSDPDANVIAYSLWGNEQRHLLPLMENVRILPHLFPQWTIRVYHDASVDRDYIATLGRMGVQIRHLVLPPGQPGHRRSLWRFEAAADPSVKRFLIRDAGALLSVKERVAIDAWCQSNAWFHAMRDWYTHTDPIQPGLWGGIGGLLPPPSALLRLLSHWREESGHLDRDVLADTVWPSIRHSLLVHDSIYTGVLGGSPFPPYGYLPPGHHIGQNAFVHFQTPG